MKLPNAQQRTRKSHQCRAWNLEGLCGCVWRAGEGGEGRGMGPRGLVVLSLQKTFHNLLLHSVILRFSLPFEDLFSNF